MRGDRPAIDKNNPRAFAICDRGGEICFHHDLRPELHWAGGRLVPNGLLVCDRHRDEPNPQTGARVRLKRDPEPVRNPRPPDGAAGPIPPPLPVSKPIHDSTGHVMWGNPGDVLMDLPEPTHDTTPLTDAHGALLLDAEGFPMFPE